jgi:hypothetical protein
MHHILRRFCDQHAIPMVPSYDFVYSQCFSFTWGVERTTAETWIEKSLAWMHLVYGFASVDLDQTLTYLDLSNRDDQPCGSIKLAGTLRHSVDRANEMRAEVVRRGLSLYINDNNLPTPAEMAAVWRAVEGPGMNAIPEN